MTTTTTTRYDVEETLATLREVAATKPDYVYKKWTRTFPVVDGELDFDAEPTVEHTGDRYGVCLYKNPETGAPDCIVGVVASRFGLLDELTEDVGASGQGILQQHFTEPALRVLSAAQYAQDQGVPWGLAAEYAGKPDSYSLVATYLSKHREEEG